MNDIIDCHAHLSDDAGSIVDAMSSFVADMDHGKISKAILLHLGWQEWHMEDLAATTSEYQDRIALFVNIDPRDPDAVSRLRKAITEFGYKGLKLHPRMERYPVDDDSTIALVREAGRLGVPVTIDAFPEGEFLMDGFDVTAFGRLGLAAPDTRIIVAHMAGHHCIDLMMIAKRIPNLWMDTSFSLLYYRGSSVTADLVYCMRSMRFDRIVYGSDFPDRDMRTSAEDSIRVLKEHGLTDSEIDRIMHTNAQELGIWG